MANGLFTALSGIRVNQTKLSVVADNLANVNTTAFKSSTVNFRTVFSDTISGGTAPSGTTGGTNPRQIGNGATISDIPVNFAQGGSIFTGKNTDLQISGEGFFTVQKIDSNGGSGFRLTRAGNFTLDANGNLVTADGSKILGTRTVNGDNSATVQPVEIPQKLRIWKQVDPATSTVVQTWIGDYGSGTITAANMSDATDNFVTNDVELVSFSFGTSGEITGVYSNGDRVTVRTNPLSTNLREMYHLVAEGTTYSQSGSGTTGTVTIADGVLLPEYLQLRMATVTNPMGLTNEGNNLWNVSANSGTTSYGIANSGSRGTVISGALESSNVEVAQEFANMITAQRGLEAASKVVTVQSEVLRTIIGIV